ncbi:hypothetical protein [Cronobacter condimenti]|nr:hypothetical protein [Cronobacter condimenti]
MKPFLFFFAFFFTFP